MDPWGQLVSWKAKDNPVKTGESRERTTLELGQVARLSQLWGCAPNMFTCFVDQRHTFLGPVL